MKVVKRISRKSYAVKFEIKDDNKKIAWAYLYIIYQDRHKEPYGLIENVYVEEAFRSRGLGKRLVKLATREAKLIGCYKLIGTSKLAKVGVHKFYEKLGFKKVGFEFRKDLKQSKTLQKD